MVAPFDPQKPLAGVAAEGYLRAQIAETEYLRTSGTKLLEELRDLGLEVRTQDFFTYRREALGLRKYQEQIEGLKPETRVPRAWINDEHGWDIKKDFLYRVEVVGLDINTGEPTEAFYSIGTNKEFPVGDVEASLIALLVGEEDFYEILVQDAHVYQAMAARGVLDR